MVTITQSMPISHQTQVCCHKEPFVHNILDNLIPLLRDKKWMENLIGGNIVSSVQHSKKNWGKKRREKKTRKSIYTQLKFSKRSLAEKIIIGIQNASSQVTIFGRWKTQVIQPIPKYLNHFLYWCFLRYSIVQVSNRVDFPI